MPLYLAIHHSLVAMNIPFRRIPAPNARLFMFEAQEKSMEDKAATARAIILQPISEFSKASESMIMKHYWISMGKQGPTTTLTQHMLHE